MEKITQQNLESIKFDKNYFGNWVNKLDEYEKDYKNAQPYSHVIIDNFLDESVANILAKNFSRPDENWWHYSNPIEDKYSFDDLEKMNEKFREFFFILSKQEFIEYLKKITDILNLEYDPYFHGAGIHYHAPDGKLNMHLDYSINPYSKKERRLNIIYFLNEEWKDEWNGFTELWNEGLKECKKKVEPKFNRALLFKTFDESWHGLPSYIKCPEGNGRKSLAIYYVSDPRENKNLRKKALFSIRPEDQYDERMQKLLEIRSDRRITDDDLKLIWPEWRNESKKMYDFDSVVKK